MPFMLSICTPDAVVVSTSSNHLAWLGRSRDGVIGHRCSEWANPRHWDLNWHLFQHSLSTGMSLSWDRTVLRADGSQARGCVMVRPIRTRKRGVLMLCANSVALARDDADPPFDATRCFTELADVAPISMLQPSFEELASHVAEAASHAFGWRH